MGDWRTVHIVGSCGPQDIPALKKAITNDSSSKNINDWNFHCLCGGLGLFGLPMWAKENIDAVGNLAERNYDEQSVERQLKKLAEIAPSLMVFVHVGAPYEETNCVATVALKDGVVTMMPPQVAEIGEVSEAQVMQNFYEQLMKPRL